MGEDEARSAATARDRAVVALLVLAVLLSALWAGLAAIPTVDTWVALACGRHIDAHGVSSVDPFSSASRPAATDSQGLLGRLHPSGWINQNWLTHLLFYWLARVGGMNALVVWKLGMVVGSAAVLWLAARRLGASRELAAGAAIAATLVSRSFLDIRPQMFSNLLTAVMLLVLVVALRRDGRHAWWVVPLVAVWANVHGGFVAAFIFLGAVVAGRLIGALLPGSREPVSADRITRWLWVACAALAVSVVLSPYHLANLTHPLEVSVSKRAEVWRTVGEWSPAFDLSNPVGDSRPFLVLAGTFALALVAWLWRWRRPPVQRDHKRRKAKVDPLAWWPRLQPSLLLVGLVAVAMALKSRRFIPIASFVICPLIALLVQEVWTMISRDRGEAQRRTVPSLRRRWWAPVGGLVLVAVGSWWCLDAYRLYVSPWPAGKRRDSVFFRMTASHHRPFDACRFLSANAATGKVFNFWADGGFLAWCQEPDSSTGRLPLAIFIDGRSQAAYDVEQYLAYLQLRNGGPVGSTVLSQGRAPTAEEGRRMAQWLMGQLRGRGIDLVVASEEEFGSQMVQVLYGDPRWKAVYVDDRDIVFADGGSELGRRLLGAVMNGTAAFPTDEARDLTVAVNLARSTEPTDHRRAFELSLAVLERAPTQTAMLATLGAARGAVLQARAREAVTAYTEDFARRKEALAKEPGFLPRLQAAIVGLRYLHGPARSAGEQAPAASLARQLARYEDELALIQERLR